MSSLERISINVERLRIDWNKKNDAMKFSVLKSVILLECEENMLTCLLWLVNGRTFIHVLPLSILL